MWTARCSELEARRGLHFTIDRQARPATFADILQAWRDDAAFSSLFSRLLADAPFAAFRWETPPVTSSTVMERFEFVILDSPALARQPDPEAFAEHFAGAVDKGVIVIPNLSGDAILIVP